MTPPPTDEKALPGFSFSRLEIVRGVGHEQSRRLATESDLSAQLEALDPDVRARVLEPYFKPEAINALPAGHWLHVWVGDTDRIRELLNWNYMSSPVSPQVAKMQAELTAARAEVERLRAFFREHGENAYVALAEADDASPELVMNKARVAIDALLRTLPKADPDPKEPT